MVLKNHQLEMIQVNQEGEMFENIWSIYTASFPQEEQREKSQHLQFLKDENYKLYAFLNNDELIGFLSCWILSKEFLFIAHFAIHPNCRASGYGSSILQKLISMKESLGVKNIILEVDDPEHNSNPEICIKRIQFYNRNGFSLNHALKYPQPPLKKTDNNDDYIAPRLKVMTLTKVESCKNLKDVIMNEYYNKNSLK